MFVSAALQIFEGWGFRYLSKAFWETRIEIQTVMNNIEFRPTDSY